MLAIACAMAVLFAWIRGVLTRLSGTGKRRSASESSLFWRKQGISPKYPYACGYN
jgi:hypothetical protein